MSKSMSATGDTDAVRLMKKKNTLTHTLSASLAKAKMRTRRGQNQKNRFKSTHKLLWLSNFPIYLHNMYVRTRKNF